MQGDEGRRDGVGDEEGYGFLVDEMNDVEG
jgi:hypothetical protein